MSSQPVSADQWINVGTSGTVLVTDRPCRLSKVILGGTYVGSIEFYDTRTTAGTSVSGSVFAVGLPLVNQYKAIDINARFKNGLVYVATGTPALTFTWD